jgi:hypothetical protein
MSSTKRSGRWRRWWTALAVVAIPGGILAVPPAAASPPEVTAGPGSTVVCSVFGPGTIKPPLKNNWLQADHTGPNADPNPNPIVKEAMASIPNTIYSANNGAGTVVTTTYTLMGRCNGSVTDGTYTTAVKAITIHATQVTNGADPATCAALAEPFADTFTETINWTGRPATKKIAPTTATTTVTDLADEHGIGFEWDSTSVTGSFAGGQVNTSAYIDNVTLNAMRSSPPTFDHPVRDSACEPTLHAKLTPASAGTTEAFHGYLTPPPGFRLIHVGLADGDNAASSITATR